MLIRNDLYLNICTTEDLLIKPPFITKINRAEKPMMLHNNAGSIQSSRASCN